MKSKSALFAHLLAATAFSAATALAAPSYQAEITVDGYSALTALENFPVLVRVSPASISGFSYSNCAADGADVAFKDASGNALDREIESWTPGGESLVWVRLPALAGGLKFKMTWGDSSVTTQPASQTDGSVWQPAGYVGVWHFGGNGTDSAYGTAVSSTAGSPSFTTNATYAGPLGKGLWLDGSSSVSYDAGGPWAALGSGSTLTVSCWARFTGATPNYGRMVTTKSNWQDAAGYELTTQDSFTIITVGAAGNKQMQTTVSPGMNTAWRHLAATYSGATASLFMDGTFAKSDTLAALAAPATNLRIGSAGDSDYWTGGIDEVRIRTSASSAEWLQAEYAAASSAAFLSYGAASAYAAAQPPNTRFTSELTVSGYTGASSLANFPALVRVSEAGIDGFRYADCAEGGSDIVFLGGDGNFLSREIDTWNTNGESLVWVRLPAMATNTTFTMAWGDAYATSQPTAQTDGSVWTPAGYVGVWHMNEANGAVADATAHGLTATPTGNTANSIAVSGAPTGAGRQTATSAEKGYLSIPNYDSFGVGSTFTMSGWMNMTGLANWPRPFSRKSYYTDDNGWEIEMANSYTAFSARGRNNDKVCSGSFPQSHQDNWAHISVVYNGSTLSVYQNGGFVRSATIDNATDNALPLSIGCNSNGSEAYIQGAFDECRLIDAVAPADWIKAEYETVHVPGFLTYGEAVKASSESVLRILGAPVEIGSPSPAYGVVDGLEAGDPVSLSMSVTTVAGAGTVTNYLAGWTLEAVDLDTGTRTSIASSADPGATFNAYAYTHAGYAEFTWTWQSRDTLGVNAPMVVSNGGNSLDLSIPVSGIGYTEPSATLKLVYGVSPDAMVSTNLVSSSVTSIGEVAGTLTRLTPGTAYYVKAVIDNGDASVESPVACLVTEAAAETTDRIIPGLYHASFTSGSAIDTGSYAGATTNVVLSPDIALTTDAATWGDNTTHVYWGLMYLDGSTYNFAESIDDAVWLKIDGSMVLNDSKWDGTTVGSITRPAGWYDFEVRFYNGSGGAGPVDKDGWGTTTFGFGCNTSGYTGKAASNYTFPVDNGTGSVFRAPDKLPGITATENVSGGTLASIELSFPALDEAATLYMAYGPSHGGEDPAGWTTASVAPLATGATSYSWTPPANWGVGDFLVVRFYYMDSNEPVWSNSIFWRDYSLPSVAGISADGTGGDSIILAGGLASFGGATCAITAYLGASPDAMTNAWPCGVRDATGDFSFTLFEADSSSARRIVPGATYYVSLEASSGGQVSRSPAQAVTTKAAPVFKESSVFKVGRTITVTAALSDCGTCGSAQVRLYYGTSEDESAFVPAGNAVTVTDGAAFTIQRSLPEFNVTYWWQLRAAATTTGGEALEARTAAASIEMTDDAEYTWKSSVASGNWDDPANWTANKSGDIIGYPSSRHANAIFAANTEATVTVRASHSMSRFYVKAGASVSLVGGAANGERPTLTPWICNFEYEGGMVSLDGVAIVTSENIDVGTNRKLRMRNNAYFEFRSFPNYNLRATTFDIKDSTMRRTGVDSFRVRTGPAGAVTGVFDGGRIESQNGDAFSVGVGDGTYAHVIMTNGQFVGYGHVFAGESGVTTGILEFLDGCELVTTKELVVIQAGGGSSSTGTLRVCDSTVYNTHGRQDVEWMVAGKSGTGNMEFSGAYVSNTWGYATIAKDAGSTGALVLSNGTTIVINKIAGGAGTSTLVADGAVAVPKLMKNKTVVEDFIYGIGTASLGANGLTVQTDYATTISQSFSDRAGESGLLVLAGPGAKTLSGASTHAVTRLDEGSTRIAVDHGATVEVAGGVLDLADGAANAVAYGGLVVGTAGGSAGILAMDAEDTITTTAAPVFHGVYLALNGTPTNGVYTLVQTTAAPTAATEAAWRDGYLYSGRQEGKAYFFDVEEENGVTSFILFIDDAANSLFESVWIAPGTAGAFDVEANWDTPYYPGPFDMAIFSDMSSATNVVLDNDCGAAALVFNSLQDYTLSGQGSIYMPDTGAGHISALAGAHEIALDLSLKSVIPFEVDAGAALEISGDIVNGAVLKTGDGTLVLSGEGNSFMDKMTVKEGILSLASAEAAGVRADSASNDLVLEGGTFRFNGSNAAETLGRRIFVDAGSSKAAVADIESPLVATSLYLKTGSFIKRGPGKLTFDFSENTTVSRERGNLQHLSSGSVFAFPATGGMADTGYFAGFSVAEGVVEWRGPSSVMLNGGSGTYLDIGLNTSSGTVDPELILNGLRYGDNANFQIGASSAGGFARNFTYRLINGARHGGNSIYICGFDNGPDDSSNIHIDIDDASYLAVSYSFRPPELQYGHLLVNVRNGSALAVPGLELGSPFDILVENSSFGKNSGNFSDAVPGTGSVGIGLKYNARGEFTVSNGVFRVNAINRRTLPNYNTVYSTNGVSFNFDNAVWHSGTSDVALRIREAETVSFNVKEGGLVISNDLGHTFLTAKAFTGPGALTKAGAGDLVFEPAVSVKGNQVPSQSWDETTVALGRTYTLDVTGGLNVLGGAVHVTAATMRPGLDVYIASGAVLDLGGDTIEVASLSGAGTIRNGTVRTRLLKVDVDAGAITLDNATIDPGRVVIDFGRTASNPLVAKTVAYDVCRFTASAPDFARWKAVNTGLDGVAGRFYIDDETVKVVFQYIAGTMLIIQ